jgi:ribosome modulation factor
MAKRSKNMEQNPVQTMTPDELAAKKKECLEAAVLLEKEMDEAKKAVKSVSGKINANKKAFKKLGGEKSDYDWYLDTRKRDTDDVDAETRRRNEIAVLMGLPIGTQLGLFADGQTVATAIENDDPKPAEDAPNPKREGYDAAMSGKSELDCPYKRGDGRRNYWLMGHKEGLKDNITKTFKADNPGVRAEVPAAAAVN